LAAGVEMAVFNVLGGGLENTKFGLDIVKKIKIILAFIAKKNQACRK
jgi:hypothetical protein